MVRRCPQFWRGLDSTFVHLWLWHDLVSGPSRGDACVSCDGSGLGAEGGNRWRVLSIVLGGKYVFLSSLSDQIKKKLTFEVIVAELLSGLSDLGLLARFIRHRGREIGCVKIQYVRALDFYNIIILRDIIKSDDELDFRLLLYRSNKHCLHEDR